MTSTPDLSAELLNSGEIALNVLFTIANMEDVGPLSGSVIHEENVVTLLYDCLLPGYPGWKWAVTLTKAGEDEPVTVSETNLQPGEESLLAPEWVPWSKRLADFRKAQALQLSQEAEAEAAREAAELLRDEDDVDPEEDLLENDFSGFDDELDGVDIDILAETEMAEEPSTAEQSAE